MHSPGQRATLKIRWWTPSMGIWDHIVRESAPPFLLALSVIMFVFLLQFLMRFIDRIVGKGLDVWTILQLIAFNLAWMVVLAVPMAVLVAGVMAFGSLAASNELTAMKAAGVSLGRMMIPMIVLSTLIAVFDLQFNNIILPDANHRAKDLMSDIQRKKPTLVVEPGTFTTEDEIAGYSILARRAHPATSDLEDVTIYDHAQPGQTRVLTARFGHLAFTPDFRNIVLTLREGEIHQQQAEQPTDYRRGRFSTYIVEVPASGYDFMHEGESERSGRELSAHDLLKFVHVRDTMLAHQVVQLRDHVTEYARELTSSAPPKLAAATGSAVINARASFSPHAMQVENDESMIKSTQDDIDSYMVEVHKKYAIPSACIIFALIGAPLGALAKRSGVGAGVGLSIGFFVLYWIFLIGGEKLADRQVITPFWGMWGGNLLLLLVGIVLTWRVALEARPLTSLIWLPFRSRKKISTTIAS
ncbi:MAG: LptF/LptG family permease [Bacteroidota bacterium]|nr:LptF/LptG family permease [Bacteroidota bacterium]MDP4233862.1 LptF/LptG family permease [Bacteroidota bacterium]MDP4288926.1 LptF/LptG family permease [Bacteroidota bacterium]